MDNILQVRLLKHNFKSFPAKDHYKLEYVDLNNYNTYINELKTVIELLHEQLEWDGIPTLEKCIDRFKSNSSCLLFYYNNNCIGWNWINKSVAFNWIDITTQLQPNELYAGGCFVSKKIKRPADAGLYDYNMFFNYCLNNIDGIDTIYGYCDIWNKAAIRVNYMCGWENFNWIK